MTKTARKTKKEIQDEERGMRLAIFAVGGTYNGEKVGVAYDVPTALSLTHLIRLTGGHGCKFVGWGFIKNNVEEYNLDHARRMLLGMNIRTHFQPYQLEELRSYEVHARKD